MLFSYTNKVVPNFDCTHKDCQLLCCTLCAICFKDIDIDRKAALKMIMKLTSKILFPQQKSPEGAVTAKNIDKTLFIIIYKKRIFALKLYCLIAAIFHDFLVR